MAQQTDPRILGTEPIGKLLLQYSIPAIIGMTITSLYNIIDSIFIGHGVGPMAISGLAITFPLMNLVVAFCVLISAGGSTISSIRLGQKDIKGATDVLGNTLMLCLTNAVLFGGLAYLFLDPILFFFGASSGTLPYARDFMQVILLGTPITYTMIGLNNVMRATGYPRKAMLTSLVTVIANVIIAPVFIFHFGWGIRGAAMATVLSQFIGMVWVVNHFRNKESFVHFMPGFWKMKKRIIGSIFSIGMSPFAMNVTACIIVILINKGLKEYGGDLMIGAYGIVNRLAFFFVMIVLGVNQGMQPIAGYNFGAKQYDRVMRVLKLTMIGATCVTTAGFLLGEFMPRLAVGMFTSDEELIRLAVEGMRIVFFCFPIIGFQMVATNFFMSIGMAGKAIFLSLSRQLLFLMPGLIFLPHIFDVCTEWNGSWGVWCSMPLSDFLASLVAFFMLTYQLRKFRAIGAENAAKEG